MPIQTRRLPQQLARLGVSKARLLAAATRNDLTNVAIAEAGLASKGEGELLVRLEQHSVRVLSSHRLRVKAAQTGRQLAVVSLTQLQARRGMAAAMPGRYTLDGAPRVHIALCGSGDGLQAASFEIARQGYGLETHIPLISILRTGTGDFAPGALERLRNAGIAEVSVTDVMTAASDGLDRSIGALVQDTPPLLAVHCVGEDSGEAEALALRWEEVLLALHQPIPPIVAYAGHDHPLGVTGMIRVASAQDLAQAREAAHLMDRRAIAPSTSNIWRACATPAAATPAQTPAAMRMGAPSRERPGRQPQRRRPDGLCAGQRLHDGGTRRRRRSVRPRRSGSAVGHRPLALDGGARARRLDRYGAERDDKLLFHPDMLPYTELTEAARQKDRDVTESIPEMAALAGETLRRELRIGVPRPLEPEAIDTIVSNLALPPKTLQPVVVLPLDDAGMVRMARTLLDRGLLLEAVLDQWVDELRANDEIATALADVLHRAWRIHVVREIDARHALEELVKECVDETGAINVYV